MSQQSTYTPGVKEAALERLTGFLSMRQLGSCRIDGQKTTVRSNGSGRQRTRAYAHGTGCLMPEQGMSTRRPQRRMLHRARQILRDVPTAQRDAKTKLTSACSRRWSNKGRSVHPGGLASVGEVGGSASRRAALPLRAASPNMRRLRRVTQHSRAREDESTACPPSLLPPGL